MRVFQNVAAMPAVPRTVALYLSSLPVAEKKVATIERALMAICQAHKLRGLPTPRKAPDLTEVLQGIRRTPGVAPHQNDHVLVDTLRALVEPMRKGDPGDMRDRALPCLGFASGCRRSELVALDVADRSFGDDGLQITIRRSERTRRASGARLASPTAVAPGLARCAPCATSNGRSLRSTALRMPGAEAGRRSAPSRGAPGSWLVPSLEYAWFALSRAMRSQRLRPLQAIHRRAVQPERGVGALHSDLLVALLDELDDTLSSLSSVAGSAIPFFACPSTPWLCATVSPSARSCVPASR
jgi:integrase